MSHPAAESVLTLKPSHKLAGREYLGGLLHSQDAEINEVSPFKGYCPSPSPCRQTFVFWRA